MVMSENRVSIEGKKTTKKMSIENFVGKMKRWPRLLCQLIWKVGREDPRRIIHSLKVGLALALVSLLYLLEPLFNGIGQNAMWAVLTVVVVLEFTVGATLYKGLNRGLGTFCAVLLSFFIDYVADHANPIFCAVFIGVAVFLIGTAATFMRFFPYIKKNYDYGVVIFILTFNLITVSSYRVHNLLKMAHQRFYTIAIGCGICLFMTLFIFPIWSGQDLHSSTVSKLEGLAKSIEDCVNEYFQDEEVEVSRGKSSEDRIFKGYKAVLDSKSTDEALALYASWEPRHSRTCYKFPWQQYVKLGAALRHFGYTAVALQGCLQSEIQAPRSVRAVFRNPCIQVAGEVSKVLMELADSIRKHRHCSPELLSDQLQKALQELNIAIKSQPRLFFGSNHSQANNMLAVANMVAAADRKRDNNSEVSSPSALLEFRSKRIEQLLKENDGKVLRPQLSKVAITSLEFSEALPFAAFASLLVETVARLDHVIVEVEELGKLARFKEYIQEDQVIVTCEKMEKENTREQPFPTNLASDVIE